MTDAREFLPGGAESDMAVFAAQEARTAILGRFWCLMSSRVSNRARKGAGRERGCR